LQHLQVAVGITESHYRTAADVFIDANRFAGLVVDEVDRRQFHQHRRAILHLELGLAAAADDLLGWNAINFS